VEECVAAVVLHAFLRIRFSQGGLAHELHAGGPSIARVTRIHQPQKDAKGTRGEGSWAWLSQVK
jgi:hypothetical protein